MALGDSIKAQRIVCMRKGWDPNEIPGHGSMADFNQYPSPWQNGDQVAGGRIPGGTPAPVVPEGYPESPMGEKVTWTVGGPNDDGNKPIRHTNGADPTPGMPGA